MTEMKQLLENQVPQQQLTNKDQKRAIGASELLNIIIVLQGEFDIL